jgi:HK97 family phage major capsid protein
MDRRQALAKATIDRTVAAGGLLPPGVSRKFIQLMKEKSPWGAAIDLEIVGEPEGTIKKITSGSRLLRAAAENSDDGYRAQVTFPEVPYATRKLRLPWEVTEDVFQENIEGQSIEATIVDEMATQFGLDLDDLEVNGNTADVSGDAAFLTINNGVLKLAETGAGVHRIDASTIKGGAMDKAHFFAMVMAMPNKFRAGGEFWMSPNRKINWLEGLTERATAAGDSVIVGGDFFDKPLGIKINEVPYLPDTRILYSSPKNFVRIVSWQVRKKRVTGDTDWELATRDKRGYIYFLKSDFIVRENDALVDLHTLDAIA